MLKWGTQPVVEAASASIVTRHTYEELEDMPILDKAIRRYLRQLNELLMDRIAMGEMDEARDLVAWMLMNLPGGLRCQNCYYPAGVENWKWGGNVRLSQDIKVK